MNDSHEARGDGEVDLMDELLDVVGENFEELTGADTNDEKTAKRIKINLHEKRTSKGADVENGKSSKSRSRSSLTSRSTNVSAKKSKKTKSEEDLHDSAKAKDNDLESDGKSDISSIEGDEPSMSDGHSVTSFVSRESSLDRDMEDDEIEHVSGKRKRSDSENSVKSRNENENSGSKGKKVKKKYDYMTKINYMFREARFFLMKSNNEENIDISKAGGVWSTPPQNEAKLNIAFKEARNVIMIYSVKESGKFCGFCRLSGESRRDLPPVNWLLPPGLPSRSLGGVFEVDWISKKDLSFTKTLHLYNPWNIGKPVKIGRDGQEIEPRVAEELCRLFPKDESVNLTPVLHKSKSSAREKRPRGFLRRPIQSMSDRRGRPRDRGGFRGGRMDSFRGGMYGMRRRRFNDDFASRMKRLRGFQSRGRGDKSGGYDDYPRERMRERSPSGYRSSSRREQSSSYDSSPPHKMSSQFKSYQEFMREMRDFSSRSHSAIPPMAFPPPPPFDPIAPPRYYDGPPMPDYAPSRSRSEKRPSSDMYDRSVEEFLMRTREKSRDHSRERERRYRERR